MGNQIETIKKLYVQTKTYKIPKDKEDGKDQIEVEISPLSMEDMGCLDMREDTDPKEMKKNMEVLLSKSLGITEEQASKISFEFMVDLLQAIMDANNFKEEDLKKTGILGFVEKKKAQIKEQGSGNGSDKSA